MPDPVPKGQSAAEVLAERLYGRGWELGRLVDKASGYVDALLAQTPDGQPVVLMPDGTLMALKHFGEHVDGAIDELCLFRLVPLSSETPTEQEGEG